MNTCNCLLGNACFIWAQRSFSFFPYQYIFHLKRLFKRVYKMARPSPMKTGQYLEWHTNLPSSSDGFLRSPTFMFQGIEWRLLLAKDVACELFWIRMEKLTPDLRFPPITATTYSQSVEGEDVCSTTMCARTILHETHPIWDCSVGQQHTQCHDVKFLFLFECDVETAVKEDSPFYPVKPCTESLVEDLQKLLEKDKPHDLKLKCGDKSIPVHKMILSARSTVFEEMLTNDTQERSSGVVEIADMDFSVLEHLVRYIYCGTLPDLSEELAVSLYKAGARFAVKGLMKRCAQFLSESLDYENVFDILALAGEHSDEEFKKTVIRWCIKMDVPKDDPYDWARFCESHPLLGLEVLNKYVSRN